MKLTPFILGALTAALLAGAAQAATANPACRSAPCYDKAQAVLPVLDDATKPVAFGAIGGEAALPAEFLACLDAGQTVFFRSPERALRAMAHLTTYGRALRRWAARARPREAGAVAPPGVGVVPEYVAKPWLAAAKIPVPRGSLARSATEAVDIALSLGCPVALKAQSKDLPHKSDVGGVILRVVDADGRPVRALGATRDITDEVEAAEQLQRQTDQLEDAQRRLGRLAPGIELGL